MEVNIPEVVSEVRAVFDAYEGAMPHYDVETMNLLFWNSPLTLRYGPNGALHGHEAIAAFRKRPSAKGLHRVLHNTVITTFGRDFAVANTEAHSGRSRFLPKSDLGSYARRLANCVGACFG